MTATRQITVFGLNSCLQPIPGVRSKDVLAFKQRSRLGKTSPAQCLIVDHMNKELDRYEAEQEKHRLDAEVERLFGKISVND